MHQLTEYANEYILSQLHPRKLMDNTIKSFEQPFICQGSTVDCPIYIVKINKKKRQKGMQREIKTMLSG